METEEKEKKKIKCPVCEGTGFHECGYCDGSGEEPCSRCNEVGEIEVDEE